MFELIVYSFYIACSVVPFIIVLAAAFRIARTGGAQVLLCMECGQCNAACPVVRKYGPDFAGPAGVMAAVKAGTEADIEGILALCTGCTLCERTCPRGLSPLREIRRLGGDRGEPAAAARSAGEMAVETGKIGAGGKT